MYSSKHYRLFIWQKWSKEYNSDFRIKENLLDNLPLSYHQHVKLYYQITLTYHRCMACYSAYMFYSGQSLHGDRLFYFKELKQDMKKGVINGNNSC